MPNAFPADCPADLDFRGKKETPDMISKDFKDSRIIPGSFLDVALESIALI